MIVEIQGKVSSDPSKNENMQNKRALEDVKDKLKTHRRFDLPRSQTVQREIRLHENGSLCCRKLAQGNCKGFLSMILNR